MCGSRGSTPREQATTVYKHIQKLIDAGIVKEVALGDDQRRQRYPPGVLRTSGRAGPSSTNTISSPRRNLQRILRDHLCAARERWSSAKFPSPGRRSPCRWPSPVLDHRSILYSPASFWNSDHAKPVVPRPRLASRGTGAARRSHLRVHAPPALGNPLRRRRRG